jgi:16S rRNA (guanine527-N7)-methyltransferase
MMISSIMPLLTLPDSAQELLGIELSEAQRGAFERYADEMVQWNEHRANLTAITEPRAVEIRHFLDSLSVVRAVPLIDGMRLIDVGTGAGFPGLPLKILHPNIHLALLEATGKKTAFLQHMADTLGLSGVTVVNARAEDAGRDPAHREAYDVVVARSVARMPVLMEYLLPFAKVGGVCVAMKGEGAAEEAGTAKKALRILGGKVTGIVPINLPDVAETHYLIVIEKIAATPAQYPRRPGVPAKQPL